MDALTVTDLSFKYRSENEFIFKNISFSVSKGSVVVLSGLSGSGKTTLCYLLTGIIPRIYKGDILGTVKLFGNDLSNLSAEKISSDLGIVFQDPETQLFMPTVEDELAFAPENLCLSRDEIENRISAALKITGIEDLRLRETNTLSGGQKQLVAIASVLTMEPKILIFDEITSQIDLVGRQKIKELIISLKNEGKTIIIVEHGHENSDLADDIYEIKNNTLNIV